MGDVGNHEKPVALKAVTRGPHDKKPVNMNGPLYMQARNSNVVLVRRARRKEDSGWKLFVQWLIENQIGTSLACSSHEYRWRPCLAFCVAAGTIPWGIR